MSLDSTIDFSSDVLTGWAVPPTVNPSYFYYRAVGYIIPAETGLYTIGVNAGDGANLLIGGTPIVTGLSWRMTANASLEYTQSGQIMLTAGKFYSIVVEWQHGAGTSYKMQLLWTPPTVNPSLGEIEIVPSSCLSSSSTTVTGYLTSAWWNGTSGLWFPAGAGIIDFAGPHPNKTLDYIADGTYRSLADLAGFASPMTEYGDMIYEDASLGPARLGIGSPGQVLTVSGGIPVWENASSGFSNPMTVAGDLLYENATPAAARLPIGTTGQVLTVVAGEPAWENASSGFSNPMTVAGDLLYENATPAAARLPIGTTGQVLTVVAGEPAWENASSGFSNPMTVAGDLLYENATPAAARLPIGTTGQVLTVVAGEPAWENASSGFSNPMTVAGDLLYENATPAAARLPIGTTGQVLTVVAGEPAWTLPITIISIYFPVLQSSVSQEIFRMKMADATVFTGNFADSQGSVASGTSAAGTTTFIVNKNGSQIGTIVWTAAATSPSFTTTSGASQSFAVGDILTVVGPVIADVALTNWGVTLKGTRSN